MQGAAKDQDISLFSNNINFVAVDILRRNVKASKLLEKRHNYLVANLNNLPFREDIFDGVLCVDVIEHVDNKIAVFDEFARVTRKSGFFVGCSSNIINPILWLDAKSPKIMKPLADKFSPGSYERHSRFSPSGLDEALIKTGFVLSGLFFLGSPPFSNKRSNIWLSSVWIVFHKLSKIKPILYLREELVWMSIRV